MNNELFQQARAAGAAKDYRKALELYTQCMQDPGSPLAPGEAGLLYHQIGNCLIRLKDPNEAIHAYTQATADAAYQNMGAVNYNLGMAYAALHDYEDAVKHYEAAVADERYETPYKAYSGLGNALLKLGKSAEAGVAFREAALDEANPDPTKALLNLGICFMALGRPADAVASYESALQFDMKPDTRNKLNANLGQAYVASGQMQKAVAAFERAIADKTYFLSDSASVDYQRAIAAVAQGTSEVTQVITPVADMSGLDVTADGSAIYPEDAGDAYGAQDPYYYADAYAPEQQAYPVQDDDRFFTQSEEELEQWSRGVAKMERKRRGVGLKIFIVIIVLLLIAVGACAFLYTQGYGFPTQESVVQQLFNDPGNAQSVMVSGVDQSTVDSVTDILEQDPSPTIDGIDKSMSSSTAYVTADTVEGGSVSYQVQMSRDLIGWKVSDVSLYFPSQH